MRLPFLLLIIAILIIGVLVGFDLAERNEHPVEPAGFLKGVWHGWVAPVSLVLGFFSDFTIYETHNVGWWYDLGFYIAIIAGFGGLTLSRKRKA